jgi:hypothetical protein
VVTWTDLGRRQLAELCAEHDRMMAEASERTRSPPVSETDDAGLVYKEYDNRAPAPAPEDDDDFGEAYPAFDDLMKGICKFVVTYCSEKLAPRDERIAKLEAKVEVLLTLLGNRNQGSDSNKAAEVIDLPDWRKHDAA